MSETDPTSALLPLRASCPKSLEGLLVSELASLGATSLRESVGTVYFHANLETAFRACLWSRLANRIFLTLGEFEVDSADALYAAVKTLSWEEHLLPTATLAIDFQGKVSWLKNSQFGVLRCKDAIVDYFRERSGERPSIDKARPDIRIHVRLRKGKALISLDLSGESLHRRGYRTRGGLAPLKENLASAILLRSDWPGMAARGGALIDPMCGSGTLLIEAAWMAMDIAPGLPRRHWGFDQWQGHVPALWKRLREEALERRRQGLDRQWPEIRGYDASGSAVATAQENIERAGLRGRVRVSRRELSDFAKPTHTDLPIGLVVCNPPYGERLGDEASLVHLYRFLGDALSRDFIGWQAAVITGNPHLGKAMAWHSHQQYRMLNGSIESKLLLFDLSPENQIRQREGEQGAKRAGLPMTEGARMFSNRLQKNRKRLEKWLKREEVSCYRLYDADMPEYAVAVDCYKDWLVVAEYAPPATVPEEKAEARLRDVLAGLPDATGISPDRIVLKQRRRQRGKDQYQREQRSNEMLTVNEGQAKLLVNLKDFLDTGLFLDHRRVRLEIAARANGRSFLNLFCYTGTASVHAAMGGAKWTTSVDLSPKYLQWTRENLSLNGMSEARHHTIEADCVEWLKANDKTFDMILLDPPTFSNSKRTETVLDVQRDQDMLVDEAMRVLNPGGLLIFSNNRRDFKLSEALAERYRVENKTDWSLDPDFKRPGKPIHHCFFFYK